MKKLLYILLAVIAIGIYSCQKDASQRKVKGTLSKSFKDTTPPGAFRVLKDTTPPGARLTIQKDTTPPGK